jgi:hypothetical protein
MLAELSVYGTVTDVLPEINGVVLKAAIDNLAANRQLTYVQHAGADTEVRIAPIEKVTTTEFSGGINT